MKETHSKKPLLPSQKRPRHTGNSKEPAKKKSKVEEPTVDLDVPMLPFKDQLQKFLNENKGFFEAFKNENTALVLKNSPEGRFGNSHAYYKKRLLSPWNDTRVELLNESWIHGKKCLDIGCNEGVFTILLANKFCPKLLVGCDIDFALVEKAVDNMKKLGNESVLKPWVNQEKADGIYKRLKQLPQSYQVSVLGENAMKKSVDSVVFKQENYIVNMNSHEKYDTIFCMSTAKWIHLNYGDTGVKALFYKVYASLVENGIFVFEVEPWKSYKKKKYLTPLFKENYKKIRLYPQQFEDFLVRSLGFTLVEKLAPPAVNTKKGYLRDILVFRK